MIRIRRGYSAEGLARFRLLNSEIGNDRENKGKEFFRLQAFSSP